MRNGILLALVAFFAIANLALAQNSDPCATALPLDGKEFARKLVPEGPDDDVMPQTFYVDLPGSSDGLNKTFSLTVLAILAPKDDICISATILQHSMGKCFTGLGGINATVSAVVTPTDKGRAVFNVWCWDCFDIVTFSISASLSNAPSMKSHLLQYLPVIKTHGEFLNGGRSQCVSPKCGSGNYCMTACPKPTAQCGCDQTGAPACSC